MKISRRDIAKAGLAMGAISVASGCSDAPAATAGDSETDPCARVVIKTAGKAGRRLVYTDLGALHVRSRNAGVFGETPPVVLLHMMPFSSTHFLPLIDALHADRDVYAIDLPGFGQSDAPPQGVSVEAVAEAVKAALPSERVDLFGFHTGASVALALAMHNPDRVKDVLIAGVPYYDSNERSRRLTDNRPLFLVSPDAVFDRWRRLDAFLGTRVSQDRKRALCNEGVAATPTQHIMVDAVMRFDALMAQRLTRAKLAIIDEMLAPNTERLADMTGAETLDWRDFKGDVFDTAPSALAQRMIAYYDREA